MREGTHAAEPAESSSHAEPRAASELSALLGEGAEFEGKLIFEGRVRIDGKFRGDIVSDGTLVVGDHAEIEASIAVGVLIVLGGIVRGDVRAQRTVELHAPAKVFGNITAPQLMIDRGVVFEGQSRVAFEADDAARAQSDAEPASALGTPEEAASASRSGAVDTSTSTPDE